LREQEQRDEQHPEDHQQCVVGATYVVTNDCSTPRNRPAAITPNTEPSPASTTTKNAKRV